MKQQKTTGAIKKLLGIIFGVLILAAGVMLQTQTIQAAPALSKADFSKSYGKPKVNFVKWCEECGYTGLGSWAWYSVYPDAKDDEGIKIENFATKRKIKIKKSTKSQVFKQYGTATEMKVNVKNDYIYKVCGTGSSGKAQKKAIKKSKTYVDYSFFDRKDSCSYRLRFYFTKQNKVNMVVYIKNYDVIIMSLEGRDW